MSAHLSPVMIYLPRLVGAKRKRRGFSLAEFLLAIAVFAIAAAGIHSLLEGSLRAQARLNRAAQAKAIASEVIGRHLSEARAMLSHNEAGTEPAVLGQGWWGAEGELDTSQDAVFAWRVVASVHPILAPGAGMVQGVRVQAEVWPMADSRDAQPPIGSDSLPGLRRVVTHLTASPPAVYSSGFVSDVQRRAELRRAREEAFRLQTLDADPADAPAIAPADATTTRQEEPQR